MKRQNAPDPVLERNKKNVFDFYDTALNKKKPAKAIAKYAGSEYRQHNPRVPDGKEGFIKVFESYANRCPEGKSTFWRLIAEGNYVGVHVHHQQTKEPDNRGSASLDIFMVDDNGKIVEHWDAMQTPPAQTISGRSMYDGPMEIMDYDKTYANKELVKKFVNIVLIDCNRNSITDFFDGDNFIQHDPKLADGSTGLLHGIEDMERQIIPLKYHKLHRIIAEGNFIQTQSEGEYDSRTTAIMDLFRIENGKIAEHWNVIWEELPEKMEHNNGLF